MQWTRWLVALSLAAVCTAPWARDLTPPATRAAAKAAVPPLIGPPAPRSSTGALTARHPLPRPTLWGSRVVISTVHPSVESPATALRIEVPVANRPGSDLLGDKLHLPTKTADFQIDVGTYATLNRNGAPHHDASGRLVLTPSGTDTEGLRDADGRSRTVPQVTIGLNVRF